MMTMMMPATVPRVVLEATAPWAAHRVRLVANARIYFCNTVVVDFIFSSEQKASCMIQNGACTQRQAFVYRVCSANRGYAL